jgi:NADPH-dependent ferric siderophore reductase
MDLHAPARHGIERYRHESKRRLLTVVSVLQLTPGMRRIEFSSPDLHDFLSRSPDDHIKLFLPDPSSAQGSCMRDYTPRDFDLHRGVLTIDFALHGTGPATAWAAAAKAGDQLQVGGPRGSVVLADDFDFYLLVGDETALPSIGRRVQNLRAGVSVTTAVIVDGPAEIQHFNTHAEWHPLWLFRSDQKGSDGAILRDALAKWQAPEGEGYVWIAAEAQTARIVRDYMLEEKGHPKAWLKSAGYWVNGKAGTSEK